MVIKVVILYGYDYIMYTIYTYGYHNSIYSMYSIVLSIHMDIIDTVYTG